MASANGDVNVADYRILKYSFQWVQGSRQLSFKNAVLCAGSYYMYNIDHHIVLNSESITYKMFVKWLSLPSEQLPEGAAEILRILRMAVAVNSSVNNGGAADVDEDEDEDEDIDMQNRSDPPAEHCNLVMSMLGELGSHNGYSTVTQLLSMMNANAQEAWTGDELRVVLRHLHDTNKVFFLDPRIQRL